MRRFAQRLSWKPAARPGAGRAAAALGAGAVVATIGCHGNSVRAQVPNTASAAPPRPTHHVLRPQSDPRIDPSVMIRYDPPGHLRSGAAVVICPGGNYEQCCMDHEGQKVAVWLTSLGITAFVVRYRLLPEGHYWPAPLEDLELAIRLVRDSAAAWGLDAQRIGVMGFSAGGHLAGMAATGKDPALRPNAQILVYPAIDGSKPAWWPWKSCDGHPPQEASPLFRIDSTTPPAFLTVSSEDDCCSAEDNTLPYAERLQAAGVPVEHLVMPMGKHGHGLKGGWVPICEAWLARRGWTASN